GVVSEAATAATTSALVSVLVAPRDRLLGVDEERVELLLLGGRLGRRLRDRRCVVVGRGPAIAPLEEGVVGRPTRLERLAGKSLEGRPALALLARGEIRRGAGAGRDELADDDVLLEPDQVILGAVDGRLGEHPGRLLERRRRQEAGGVERGLRDPEQDGLRRGGLAALGQDPVVDLLEVEP